MSALATFCLQISQRLGAIALFSTLAAWTFLYLAKDFHLSLAVAAVCANLGLCLALIARLLTAPDGASRREANGVALFNLMLFALAIQLMVVARLDLIRLAASRFFTPNTPANVHG